MEMDQYVNVPEAKKNNLDTRLSPGSGVITVVAVSFGLLCVLQASLNISLRLIYWRNWTDESQMNQTEERDQLQISYDKLSNEKGQLQISYNKLSNEKGQLQISYNKLSNEKGQLQISYDKLSNEKGQLQISYDKLSTQKRQLQISHNRLENEKKTLQTEITTLNSRIRACSPCNHGWTKLDSSCYYISTEQKTWEESRQDCRQRGARLVIINSEKEQELLTLLNIRVWIGLWDKNSNRVWKWVDGASLDNGRYWKVGEPNNYGGTSEDCVEIRPENDGLMNWNDDKCSFQKNWVCEH
ncbi:CD209 antigen-like isoform X1 [Osmerus mordax]|uniref:CD209 antigen-like isoform X1 n=1 Tax=Osmerus mordax TaxID=8014 RepID=UPI00350F52BB